MRAFMCGLVATAVVAGGCNRADPARTTTGTTTPGAAADRGPASAAAPEKPVAARAAEWREVTLPAGTRLPIVLETSVGSDTSHAEEPVEARLARAVSLHGETVLPEGSRLSGVVTEATRSGKVKGRAHVAIRFDTVTAQGPDAANEHYAIRTALIGETAQDTKKKDAIEIGAPAAGGALVGALLGGKKGALVGTAVGGGAGTGVVLSTRGKEVHMNRGAALTLQLSDPLTVRVRPTG
jgi:hypothetical protein